MKFKEPKLKTEHDELYKRNPKLYALLGMLDGYCVMEFKKEITITHLFRTPEEQKQLYSQTPNPPTTSPHMFWKACDIRSKDFTDAEIKKMLTFLNCFSYTSGQGKPVAIYHVIAGNTYHMHIQAD